MHKLDSNSDVSNEPQASTSSDQQNPMPRNNDQGVEVPNEPQASISSDQQNSIPKKSDLNADAPKPGKQKKRKLSDIERRVNDFKSTISSNPFWKRIKKPPGKCFTTFLQKNFC